MTGQKLVIFVGVAALMWFHKLASEQDEFEGMLKHESIYSCIRFIILLNSKSN